MSSISPPPLANNFVIGTAVINTRTLKQAGVRGGVVLALQSAALSEDVLLLCDNEAVLCAIKKWVGQGGKASHSTGC